MYGNNKTSRGKPLPPETLMDVLKDLLMAAIKKIKKTKPRKPLPVDNERISDAVAECLDKSV